MTTLLLALALLFPARAGSTPLVHVEGSYRFGGPGYVEDWVYVGPDEGMASTLGPGEWVEVRLGGSCTLNGVTHRSGLLWSSRCQTPVRRAL
jgi:hypothetical protein